MQRRDFLVGASVVACGLGPSAIAKADKSDDWPNIEFYQKQNEEIKALGQDKRLCVFMGDSITWNWADPKFAGTFLNDHGYVGRGISGQTTPQMLVRFWTDVVHLRPKVVHILAGTNDIAGNTGPYSFETTTNALQSMVSLAVNAGIKVAIGSVPPANIMPWRKELGNPTPQITRLNTWLRGFCEGANHSYIDYWSVLAGKSQELKPELGIDAVHPSAEGYRLMNGLALKSISSLV